MSKHAFLGGTPMIAQETILVQLIRLIDRIPAPPPPTTRRSPGRPIVYSERLFLKALLIMIVRRLHKVGELLAVRSKNRPHRCDSCALGSPRRGASPRGALSSGGSKPCPRRCRSRSALWGATWWRCSDLGRVRDERWRWTARCLGPKTACGTRKTGRRARCPTPP